MQLEHLQQDTIRPSFPWTRERIAEYARQHAQPVQIRGQYLTRFFVWSMLRLLRLLSWNNAYRFGTSIGRLLHVLKVRRSIAMTNLDIVFGDGKTPEEKNEIYRKSLLNLGRQVVNYMRIRKMDDEFWQNDFELLNGRIIDEAYNKGRGVILIYSHFGPWELPGGRIAHAGYPISVVAKRLKNSVMERLVVGARRDMNLGTIKHRDAMDRIITGLKNGEGIVMVIDQNMKRSQGVFVQWLGRVASTVKSTAWIARQTGAAVITGYAVQYGPRKFKMVMTEEVPWETHEDPQQELIVNTQNYARAVEKHIYDMPEQWFWLHRRWKLQPEGVPNPYH